MSVWICRLSRFLPLVLFVLSTPVSAQNCSLPDPYNINCDFSGVAPEQAIQELDQVVATAEVDQVVRQAAQQMLPLLNDETIAANPNAALRAYVALGNSIREDDYWERALAIVVAGQAPAPIDNRDFLEFVGRYMHSQRMAGVYDLSVQAARATYGSTAQPSGGRQLQGYGPLDMQRHDGHTASIQLIEAWEGRSPLDSELMILHALDGDPQAQFLIGQHLVETGTHRGLNLSRVTTRTGHFENGPFDADRGLQFLEAAFAAGVTEAGPVLERYYTETARIAEEERLAAEAAAAEQAERDRIAQEAREARQAEAAERAAEFARNGTAMDQYLREQNTHVNRIGMFWNSCVSEAQSPQWGPRYCDCIVVRSVELLGQERANVALATGVGISDQFLGQVVGFCVDLTRR